MRIAVIGGGAAGFMAAITAKEMKPSAHVTIFEKTSKVLAKVKVSGGGRCNVTHATFSIAQLVKNYPRGRKSLKKMFNHFSSRDTVNWFNSRGVGLKTEADNRMFPESNKSETIVNLLMQSAGNLNINISYSSKMIGINPLKDRVELVLNSQVLIFDRVIIAIGGIAKKQGFDWLRDLNYVISEPVPSLFTFNIPNNSISELMGLSVLDATVSIKGSKLKQHGPVLITHWGMSGPAIIKLSAWAARDLESLDYNFILQVNWISSNEEDLRSAFSLFACSKKLIYNYNPLDIPKRLWYFILNKLGISSDQIWDNLSKKNINRLINALINDEFEVRGKTTFKEEFVTCGGVNLSNININTMESKLHKGVFFAGELLDIDGVTGGFNFQAAWTTGYLAGKNSVL